MWPNASEVFFDIVLIISCLTAIAYTISRCCLRFEQREVLIMDASNTDVVLMD